MYLLRKMSVVLVAATFVVSVVAVPAKANGNEQVVCTSDQVLPGFGFLPITFSPFIASLFGVNPANCQTPIEPFQ